MHQQSRPFDVAQDAQRIESLRELAIARGLAFHEISSVTGAGIETQKFAMAAKIFEPQPPAVD
jgi:hypothetical protein